MVRTVAPTMTATLSTGLVLKVRSAVVILDAGQAPYGQVQQLVCARPTSAQVATIDPRQHQRITVVQDDHADTFGGTRTTRTLDLVLTGRLDDPVGGTLTLSAATDEAVLIGRGLMAASSKQWPAVTVQQLVGQVLASLGYSCTFGAPDYAIDSAAAAQAPGQSYWDFLDGAVQAGNLRLWCSSGGAFHLDDKSTIQPGQLRLAYGIDLSELTDNIDITSDAFYDALVVRYSYTDAGGNPQTAYDYAASSSTPVSTGIFDFQTAPAVPGAARRLLRRMTGRGRVLTQEAVSRFDVTPGQAFVVTMPDNSPDQSGLVQAVSWRYPDTRMAVTTRELSDTISTMWAAQAAGVHWSSVPAGTSWTEYLAVAWNKQAAGTSWASAPVGVRWSEYGNT